MVQLLAKDSLPTDAFKKEDLEMIKDLRIRAETFQDRFGHTFNDYFKKKDFLRPQ